MALPITPVTLPAVLRGQTNGRLDPAILVSTPGLAGGPAVVLVAPAARGWRAMCASALAAGHTFKVTSSYRTLARQDALWNERYDRVNYQTSIWWDGSYWIHVAGAVAARPGTSNHGLGLAVDIGEERDGDAGTESIDQGTVDWLVANAGRFGFSAELQDEEWHWRYVAGDAIPAAVLRYEEEVEMLNTEQNNALGEVWATIFALRDGKSVPKAGNFAGGPAWIVQQIQAIQAATAADQTRDAAMLAAIQALSAAGGVEAAPIVAAIQSAAAESRQAVEQLQDELAGARAEVADLRRRLAAGAAAEAAALKE